MMKTSMQRFWVLIKVLLFPHAWLRGMVKLGAALVLIGLIIHLKWHNPLCAIFGGILIMTNMAMNFIALPNQLLSLNSSKQFGILPGLRQQSGVIYFIFSVLISIAVTLIFSLESSKQGFQFFLAVFLMASAFTIGNLFLALRWNRAQGFLYMIFVMLPNAFAWLVKIDTLIILSGLIMCWSVFFRCWLTWRPAKLHKSIFGMTIDDALKNQQEVQSFWHQGIFRFVKIRPQTLLGTLLFGSADGWLARMKSAMSGLVLTLLFLALYRALLGSSAIDGLIRQADIYFFIAYISSSFAFHGVLFRNLHKVWMFYSESRSSLLSSLEKFYYPWSLSVIIPLAIIHLTTPNFVAGMVSDVFLTLSLITFALALLAFNFYLSIVIYCKTLAHYSWVLGMNMGVMLVSTAIVIPLYFSWADHKLELFPFVLVCIIALFGGVILLRHWAKKCCLNINFLRVKS